MTDISLEQELSDAQAKLPNRTLFQLALAGLKVRLTRSAVTEISIVLAIAYLTYSGVTNSLLKAMAMSGSPEVDTALRRAGINVEATRQGNPLDWWLLVMALLTCTVGIANAMLMSVTERFREIGTMKCLGAEDSMVVKLFLIESALLGVVGSIIGVIVGAVMSVLVAFVQFGGEKDAGWTSAFVFQYLPVNSFLTYSGLSFLAGMMLCLIGAGYPALVAAKMRPVEALRVEE